MGSTLGTWARDAVWLAGVVIALAIWLPIALVRVATHNLRLQFARAQGS